MVMETTAQRCSPRIQVPHRVAPPRTHIASPTMSCVSISAPPEDEWAFVGELGYGWPSEPAAVLQLKALAPSPRAPVGISLVVQSVGQNSGAGDVVPQTVVSMCSGTAFCSATMTWRYDTHPSFASRSQLGQVLFVASPVAASVSVPMHCAPAPPTTTAHGPWRER